MCVVPLLIFVLSLVDRLQYAERWVLQEQLAPASCSRTVQYLVIPFNLV